MKTANETTPTTTLTPVETSRKMRDLGRILLKRIRCQLQPAMFERPGFLRYSAKGRKKHLDPIPASRLTTRLKQLRNTLQPTPHMQLAMKGIDLFAKLEYVNPVESIKNRTTY